MARHRIGLSAAWEVTRDAEQPAWVRRFGQPGGLGPSDRVFLVVESPSLVARLVLNGTTLADPPAATTPPGQATRSEWDVTPLLRGRNELAVVPASAPGAAGRHAAGRRPLPPPLGTVAIEIESAEIDSIA